MSGMKRILLFLLGLCLLTPACNASLTFNFLKKKVHFFQNEPFPISSCAILAVPGEFKDYPQCNQWPVMFAKEIAAQLRAAGITADFKEEWTPQRLPAILKEDPSIHYDAYFIVSIDQVLLQTILFSKSPSGDSFQRVTVKNGRDLSDVADIPVEVMSGLIGGHGSETGAKQFVKGTIDQNHALHNPVEK